MKTDYLNFRKRCAVKVSMQDIEYDRIYYGLDALEYQPIFEDGGARDLPTPYAALSVGGRRSGNPIENEYKTRKHFYNKRIMTDEERFQGQVRSRVDTDAVEARYEGSGQPVAAQLGVQRAGLGGGGRDTDHRRYFYHPESDSLFTTEGEEPNNDGLVEEVTEAEYNEIKRKQDQQEVST